MSDIDVALSKVNVILSMIDVELSKCQDVKSRSPLLPRLGNILSKMESIVSKHLFDTSPDPDMSWDDTSHAVWYSEEEEDDIKNDEDVMKEEGVIKEERVEKEKEVVKKKEDVEKEEAEVKVMKKEDCGKEQNDRNLEENSTDEETKEEMSIAMRVKCRKLSKLSPPISFNCDYSDSDSDPDSISSSHSQELEITDPCIDQIISVVRRIAPDLRYSQAKSDARRKKKLRKERRKVTRSVHPDLRTIWQHASEFCSPPEVPEPVDTAPVSLYLQVDWAQVNYRFLGNLPKPEMFPIESCWTKEVADRCKGWDDPITANYRHWRSGHPFGNLPGFLTEDGVIAPGGYDQVLHGFVWSDQYGKWVIQNKKRVTKEKSAMNAKKKSKRKKW